MLGQKENQQIERIMPAPYDCDLRRKAVNAVKDGVPKSQEGVTQQNMSDALKKIGLSRKKKLMVIENGMKKNEKNLGRS